MVNIEEGYDYFWDADIFYFVIGNYWGLEIKIGSAGICISSSSYIENE